MAVSTGPKIVEQAVPLLNVSDWVLIGATLFLGVCALFVPFLAELIKRKLFAPSLRILFAQENPYCHLTKWSNGLPVYYFRFQVSNDGKSQARFCEAVLEELWLQDSSGKFIQDKNFSPVNLNWVKQSEHREGHFVSINPKRKVFCDIGHISSPLVNERSQFFLERDNQSLKFIFDTPIKFFSQRDCVSPGKAKIKIGVYSENAPKCERIFQVAWSGNWKDPEEDMFREIVIS